MSSKEDDGAPTADSTDIVELPTAAATDAGPAATDASSDNVDLSSVAAVESSPADADATPVVSVVADSEASVAPTAAESTDKPSSSMLALHDAPLPPSGAVEVDQEFSTPPGEVATPDAIGTPARPRTPESPSLRHAPDSPTTSLINALRQQLELVSDQALQLNTKLVESISKHADLEDQVYALTDARTRQDEKVEELERAKAQWEDSMNTGLLVERSQIRDEMQRLAAGLVEEERKRGSAEERRAKVENEVDDLAATLFDQANTMVAAERMGRVQAEERLRETEDNLAAAEAAVRDMQTHLQTITVAPGPNTTGAAAAEPVRRLLSSHPPYAEFISFLAHLRAARPRSARSREFYPVPPVPTLLAQPFLARSVTEDHDPTLRLDAAPDLGWVSRRGVGAAIIAGDLVIEPVTAAALGPIESISCALCGRGVFGRGHGHSPGASRFSLKPFFASPGQSASPSAGTARSSVYVFRVPNTSTDKDAKSYPICRNGWCLERLRAACALWHFVRTGIVVPVWNSEDSTDESVPPTATSAASTASADNEPEPATLSAPPPLPQRSVSAPAPPAPDASSPALEQSATLEGAEPKRKAGWGLGGFRQGSWGSWGGSRPTTPGPGSSAVASPVPAVVTTDTSADKSLGAPIELEGSEATVAVVDLDSGKVAEVPVSQVDAVVDGTTRMEDVAVSADAAEIKEVDAKDTVEAKAEAMDDTRSMTESHYSGSTSAFETPSATPTTERKELFDEAAVEELKDDAGESEQGSKHTENKELQAEDAAEGINKAKEEIQESEAQKENADDAAAENKGKQETSDEAKDESEDKTENVKVESDTVEEKPEVSKDASEASSAGDSDSKLSGDATPAAGNGTATPTSPVKPTRSHARAAPPPPLPKRNAARGLASPAPTPPDTPTEASLRATAAANADDAEPPTPTTASLAKAATVAAAARAESEALAPEAVTTDAPAPVTPTIPAPPSPGVPTPTSAKPPLPPRHPPVPPRHGPVTPNAPVRSSTEEHETLEVTPNAPGRIDRDKTYLAGDNWEVRTWRQVVRLKEDMARARLGLCYADE